MATPPEPPIPALSDQIAEDIAKQLQVTLVELIALSLAGKQLHWNTYGPDFLSLHRHLDGLVDQWRALADTVAERQATIGIAAEGSAAAVIELGNLPALQPGFTEVRSAIEHLCMQLREVASRVRRRADRMGSLDLPSQDILVEVQRTLEEHLWMTRAQLAD